MLESRRFVIIGFFLFFGIVYLTRLFYLQVVDETYAIESSSNSIKRIIETPFRGQIYDRYGNLIVYNTPVYDLMVTPSKVRISDTLSFCRLLQIDRMEFDSLMGAASSYSRVKPSLFLRQLSKEEFASIQDAMVDYKGFEFAKSSLRTYASSTMANSLGYVSEITKKQLENKKDNYYRQGDYIGQSGLESFYEEQLRGKKGVKFIMQNVNGVNKGSWKNGELDTTAVAGQNLYTGIDLEVQQYADSLMINKVGSVVAIEPKTGEILTMVSAPSYDPNLLSSRHFAKNYAALSRNPYKPLFNRPVMASYRPGSTFKAIQALIGLQEGVITSQTGFSHAGSPIKCHGHPGIGNVAASLQYSCNPYYYQVFRRLILKNDLGNSYKTSAKGLNDWYGYVSKFGLADKLGTDLPSEYKGNLPDEKYYNKIYGANQWRFSNIYSLSIGEGELLITPLKIANVAAIIANKGYFYTPHLVKRIGENGKPLEQYTVRHETGINPIHFDAITEGMINAVRAGTTNPLARIQGIEIAGKTGTSQNRVGADHSIFMAYAPAHDPKIAIAVFVENGGFGGTAAATVANLVIEKYLNRTIQSKALENFVLNKNYMPAVTLPKPKPVVPKDTTKKAPSVITKSDGIKPEELTHIKNI